MQLLLTLRRLPSAWLCTTKLSSTDPRATSTATAHLASISLSCVPIGPMGVRSNGATFTRLRKLPYFAGEYHGLSARKETICPVSAGMMWLGT